ncbi:MAG: stalk domain-containing protein [Defluviitaleaceae bacterium]|nr:stalk domain-containing protein [Defluviitaleaceae bacterium]
MRKILAIMLTGLAMVILAPIALQANDINVTIDSVAVDFAGQPPVIVDGRTLVPVRGVFEALDFEVEWEQATQTVTMWRGAHFWIEIVIGSPTFMFNHEEIVLDVPAQIIDGRTMLPIRAVVEGVGYSANWDGGTGTVVIDTYIIIRGVRYSRSNDMLFLMESNLTNEDILPLAYMGRLAWLYLQNNNISDISPLAELESLEFVNLSGNPIVDWSPVGHVGDVYGRP